jgi:hypothetical protein
MFAVEISLDAVIRTKFHKDWFRISRVVRGDTQTLKH